MSKYTPRTGSIWMRAYDEGIVKKLGAILGTGTDANNYFVEFQPGDCMTPGTSLKVPVVFGNPESIFEQKKYPAFVIKREGMEPALQRWHSVGQAQEVWGLTGTSHVVNGETVYDRTELMPQAWPYDLTYSISCYGRFEYEVQTLLRAMLRKFPPRSYVTVKDSLNEDRTYECFNDSSLTDLSEIVDVSERVKAYSISVRVEGEIDLVDPITVDTVQTVEIGADRF